MTYLIINTINETAKLVTYPEGGNPIQVYMDYDDSTVIPDSMFNEIAMCLEEKKK